MLKTFLNQKDDSMYDSYLFLLKIANDFFHSFSKILIHSPKQKQIFDYIFCWILCIEFYLEAKNKYSMFSIFDISITESVMHYVKKKGYKHSSK